MNPATAAWCQSEAYAKYGNTEKGQLAGNALALSVNYLDNPPIGWNINDNVDMLEAKCFNHVKSTIQAKPSGFLPAIGITWLFWVMLESVIAWAVRRALDRKFGR